MATSAAGEFEGALRRLEEIVAKLERDDVGLDDSVTLFKEGKELAAKCERLLKNAQASIEEAAKGAPASAGPVAPAAPASLFSNES